MFDRIGGILGLAFYGAQASALCGGFVLYVAGAEGMATAWLRWTAPPTIGLALALVFALPAVGAALGFWRLVTDKECGNG